MDGPNEHTFPITRVAEHIVIEDCGMWEELLKAKDNKDQISSRMSLYIWLRRLMPCPGDPAPSGSSPYNLRTMDFAMTRVTKIDRYYPPEFVRRLFNGDYVKIVDLGDKKTVRGIEQLLVDELSQFMKPGTTGWPMDLKRSLKIFRAASATVFEHVRTPLLEELAMLYHRTALIDRQMSRGTLPMGADQDTDSDMSSFSNKNSEKDNGLEQDMDSGSNTNPEQDVEAEVDMEALNVWVKELTERLDIRLVHVFVRVDEMADDHW